MAISKKLKKDDSAGGVELPLGAQIALFLGVIHLGVQRNEYKGVETLVDQLALQFELQDVLTDKGTPVVLTKVERNSMKPKANMLKFGEAFGADLDVGIDFEELVGQPALVEIGFNEAKTKKKIKKFGSLPNILKKEVKPLSGTPRIFLDVEEITESQLKELPQWLVDIIAKRISSPKDNTDPTNAGML